MVRWRWTSTFLAIVVVFVSIARGRASEPLPPVSLGTLWEKHMLEGTFVVMKLEDSRVNQRDISPTSVDPTEVDVIYGPNFTHPISIMRLGEGFFGNGGWVLSGGLLRRIKNSLSTFELYVKEIGRRFSYIPFPPHRDIPKEVGYEFFLLNRGTAVPGATVIRKWTFLPDEVIQKNPNYPSVRAMLQYEPTTRTITLTVTGLKRPFEERVDLSSVK